MAKKQKRQFHCEKCGNPCDIYKKGKKHRVLVCQGCGVIATNPLPLIAGIVGRKVAKKALGAVALNAIGKEKKEDKMTCKVKETYSMEERVRDALM